MSAEFEYGTYNNLHKIIANQDTDKMAPKSGHNPQSLLRVGRLFQPTVARKSTHNPPKLLTIEQYRHAGSGEILTFVLLSLQISPASETL